MLIVLEGCDCTGKTTLARQLDTIIRETSSRPIHHLHFGPPKERDPRREWLPPINDYRPGREHFIIDRLHIGDEVYGPLYRGERWLTDAGRREIDLVLYRKGAVLVHTVANADVVHERMQQPDDSPHADVMRPDWIEQVLQSYEHVIPKTGDLVPVVRYDTTRGPSTSARAWAARAIVAAAQGLERVVLQ